MGTTNPSPLYLVSVPPLVQSPSLTSEITVCIALALAIEQFLRGHNKTETPSTRHFKAFPSPRALTRFAHQKRLVPVDMIQQTDREPPMGPRPLAPNETEGPEIWGQTWGRFHYSLEVVQSPSRARMCGFGDKVRHFQS